MNAPIATSAPAGFTRWSAALVQAVDAMMSLGGLVDAWIAAQQRAALDHADLAAMSERELADIGIPRSSVDAAAHGLWTRGPMI